MSIFFLNKGTGDGEYVTKKSFMNCIDEIAEYKDRLDEQLGGISVDGRINGDEYTFNFTIKNGDIGVYDTFVKNIKANGMFTRGSYWSDIDEQEGSLVALCYDRFRFDNDAPVLDRIQTDEDTLTIDGKDYKIIGYTIWVDDGAMIPIQSTNDDICIVEAVISAGAYDLQAGDTLTMYDAYMQQPDRALTVEIDKGRTKPLMVPKYHA